MDIEKYLTVIKPSLSEEVFKKIIPFSDLRQLIKKQRGVIMGPYPTFINNDINYCTYINVVFWKYGFNKYSYLVKKRRGGCLCYHKFSYNFIQKKLYFIETCEHCFPKIGPHVRRPIHISIYFFDTRQMSFFEKIDFIFYLYPSNLFKVIFIYIGGKLVPIRFQDSNYNKKIYYPYCKKHHKGIINIKKFFPYKINNNTLEDLCVNKVLAMYL